MDDERARDNLKAVHAPSQYYESLFDEFDSLKLEHRWMLHLLTEPRAIKPFSNTTAFSRSGLLSPSTSKPYANSEKDWSQGDTLRSIARLPIAPDTNGSVPIVLESSFEGADNTGAFGASNPENARMSLMNRDTVNFDLMSQLDFNTPPSETYADDDMSELSHSGKDNAVRNKSPKSLSSHALSISRSRSPISGLAIGDADENSIVTFGGIGDINDDEPLEGNLSDASDDNDSSAIEKASNRNDQKGLSGKIGDTFSKLFGTHSPGTTKLQNRGNDRINRHLARGELKSVGNRRSTTRPSMLTVSREDQDPLSVPDISKGSAHSHGGAHHAYIHGI